MRYKPSKKEKKEVNNWLKNENDRDCPFDCMCDVTGKKPYRICKSWFPAASKLMMCPCSHYKLSTVIRRAKEMIK